MSKIHFFTDEDVYQAIAEQLRLRGFDALSTPEANCLGQSDESQFDWASQQNLVLLSFNVADFSRLHYERLSSDRRHSGLIVSQQRSIGVVMQRLINLSEKLTHSEMVDRIEFLSNW